MVQEKRLPALRDHARGFIPCSSLKLPVVMMEGVDEEPDSRLVPMSLPKNVRVVLADALSKERKAPAIHIQREYSIFVRMNLASHRFKCLLVRQDHLIFCTFVSFLFDLRY